jgi:hypothetical protein
MSPSPEVEAGDLADAETGKKRGHRPGYSGRRREIRQKGAQAQKPSSKTKAKSGRKSNPSASLHPRKLHVSGYVGARARVQ